MDLNTTAMEQGVSRELHTGMEQAFAIDDLVELAEIDDLHESIKEQIITQAFENTDIIALETDRFSYVRELRRAMNEGDHERAQATWALLRDNVRTYVFETMMARGHISTVFTEWDDKRGFMAGYDSAVERFVRGELATNNAFEKPRRIADSRRQLKKEWITRNRPDVWKDYVMVTISPYLHEASDEEAKDLGYRPDNKKFMVVCEEVIEGGVCITQQLSLGGSNEAAHNEILKKLGFDYTGMLNADEIADTSVLVRKPALPLRTVTIGQMYDELSAEGLFTESIEDSWESLEDLSAQRETLAGAMIEDATARIAAGSVNVREFERIIEETVIAICAGNNELAERAKEAIGELSYQALRKAQLDPENREKYLDEAVNNIQELIGCGGGACGLEVAMGESLDFAKKSGLKGEIYKYKDGSCARCGSSGYLVDESGRMACESCSSVSSGAA